MAELLKNITDPRAAYDAYGRTANERTVELSPEAAEAVNCEVTNGDHDTYDAALAYIITRGVAEIKRQRASGEKARANAIKAKVMTVFTEMLKLNPALVNQPDELRSTLAKLGITIPNGSKQS